MQNQSSETAIRELLSLTERLLPLLADEITRMANQAPLVVDGDEKTRLAQAYRQTLAHLQAEPERLAAAPEALRRELADATQRLHTAVDAHQRALAVAKELSEGLVRAIAEEIARQHAGPTSYAAGGGYSPARQSGSFAADQQA